MAEFSKEDWLEFRSNATKYLEQHTQYATRHAVQIAIDKQIGLAPLKSSYGDLICPKCGCFAFNLEDIPKFITSVYCWCCGQRLEWD